MGNKKYKKKSIRISVETEEQMNMIKALMLSLDISFKIEEEHANENGSDTEVANIKSMKLYGNDRRGS